MKELLPGVFIEWDDNQAMALALRAGLYNEMTQAMPPDPTGQGGFIGDIGQFPAGNWVACGRWYGRTDQPEKNGWVAIITPSKETAQLALLRIMKASQSTQIGFLPWPLVDG